MNTCQACNAAAIASYAKGLIESLHKSPELMIISIFQSDMGLRPEIMVSGYSSKIEQVAGV